MERNRTATQWCRCTLLAAALTAGGCVVAERREEPPVVYEQPAPVQETVTISPGPGYVWVGGEYEWSGTRWLWVPGRWDRPARPDAAWERGRWRDSRHHEWERGHWR
jgi:hypothetical protein